MRARRSGRFIGGQGVCAALVAFLPRQHTLFKEALGALIGGLGEVRHRLRASPLGLGSPDILRPCAFIGLVRIRLRGGERAAGLFGAGFDLGTVERIEQLSRLHRLAFLDMKGRDPSRDLARDPQFAGLDHALELIGNRAIGQPETEAENDHDEESNERQQLALPPGRNRRSRLVRGDQGFRCGGHGVTLSPWSI